jgi:hypothetical protein
LLLDSNFGSYSGTRAATRSDARGGEPGFGPDTGVEVEDEQTFAAHIFLFLSQISFTHKLIYF